MKGYQLYFPIELTIFIVAVCRYKLNQTLIWVFKMSKAAVLIWLLGCCWRNCVATVQLSNAILAAATQSCQYSAIICTGYISEQKKSFEYFLALTSLDVQFCVLFCQ